jgi:thiol-disulfide isomerase/thioredoxin
MTEASEDTETNAETDAQTDRDRPIPKWIFGGAAAVALIALLAIFTSGGETNESEAAADELAAFVFTNEDGSEGTLADYRGEPVVVNFFASWCAPCKAELPDFVAVHTEAGDDVQFLGVNADLDEGTWLAFVDEFELTYPTVFQPNLEIHEHLALLGHPATVLIDDDGQVVHTFTGVLSEESLKELIAEHLGVEV